MKKAVALMLAAVLFLSVFLFLPRASFADADDCFDNWERCRQRSFYADEGWLRTTIMLSVCDFALGRCVIFMM
jgi:hypothetical protein